MPGFRSAAVLVALLVGGCADAPPTSRLDSSGLTVETHAVSLLLASPVPELTAAAQDYAVVGPVEINRRGHLDFYLWVGLGSTVDRGRLGMDPPRAEALALLLDGEPMVLPLGEWQTSLDTPPYETSAPIYDALAAPASLDQIHRIAAAGDVELHVLTRSGRVMRYSLWSGNWAEWSTFSPDF